MTTRVGADGPTGALRGLHTPKTSLLNDSSNTGHALGSDAPLRSFISCLIEPDFSALGFSGPFCLTLEAGIGFKLAEKLEIILTSSSSIASSTRFINKNESSKLRRHGARHIVSMAPGAVGREGSSTRSSAHIGTMTVEDLLVLFGSTRRHRPIFWVMSAWLFDGFKSMTQSIAGRSTPILMSLSEGVKRGSERQGVLGE